MRCLVIGLGNFGTALVQELTNSGHEVIAVDFKEHRADAIKESVETVYIMDSTDELAVDSLPLKEIDFSVVAINEDLAASLRTVINLKRKGVKNIYARASDAVHQSILEAIGDIKVIRPEVEMAKVFAKKVSLK